MSGEENVSWLSATENISKEAGQEKKTGVFKFSSNKNANPLAIKSSLIKKYIYKYLHIIQSSPSSSPSPTRSPFRAAIASATRPTWRRARCTPGASPGTWPVVSSVVCLGATDKGGFVTWGKGESRKGADWGRRGEEREGTAKSGRSV